MRSRIQTFFSTVLRGIGIIQSQFRLGAALGLVIILNLVLLMPSPALAGLQDDHYDGNIFPLYAGNGSIVPPRVRLSEAFQRDKPTLLVLYIDDSRDCKEFSAVVSQLDAYYGRVADFIVTDVDSIAPKAAYEPTEPGYYYKGFVPQTVLFDAQGNVVLNETGIIPYERVDDEFRKIFDLLPRSESVELKRRQANEINVELVRE